MSKAQFFSITTISVPANLVEVVTGQVWQTNLWQIISVPSSDSSIICHIIIPLSTWFIMFLVIADWKSNILGYISNNDWCYDHYQIVFMSPINLEKMFFTRTLRTIPCRQLNIMIWCHSQKLATPASQEDQNIDWPWTQEFDGESTEKNITVALKAWPSSACYTTLQSMIILVSFDFKMTLT